MRRLDAITAIKGLFVLSDRRVSDFRDVTKGIAPVPFLEIRESAEEMAQSPIVGSELC